MKLQTSISLARNSEMKYVQNEETASPV